MSTIYPPTTHKAGFTLVELMITIFIASLLTVAFYGTYVLQRRSGVSQQEVLEMQQNLRAAIDTMLLDMRVAGFDPKGTAFGGGNAIVAATPTFFSFAADMDENGSLSSTTGATAEYFSYDLYTSGGVSKLGRASSSTGPITAVPSTHQPVAENIEQLEFAYVLDDGTVNTTFTGANLAKIRAVRVSMLARSSRQDSSYVNTNNYTTFYNVTWGSFNDGYRRRLIKTQVDLRNMGL